MKRSIFSTLATLALTLVCLTASAFAQGGTTVTKWDFTNPSYWNACCGEYISFSGTAHTTLKTTNNADGTNSYTVHTNVSGVKGTGLSSGISYNASENSKGTQTYDPNDGLPFSLDQKISTRVVGKGKGGRECSFKLLITFRVEVDADGNVITNIINVEIDCANGTIL